MCQCFLRLLFQKHCGDEQKQSLTSKLGDDERGGDAIITTTTIIINKLFGILTEPSFTLPSAPILHGGMLTLLRNSRAFSTGKFFQSPHSVDKDRAKVVDTINARAWAP